MQNFDFALFRAKISLQQRRNRLALPAGVEDGAEFADGEACHFLGNLSVNVWNGRSSLQFVAEEAIG